MQSDSIAKLAEALALAQGEMAEAEKDSINPHFKSKFASLKSMIRASRPALSKHGIAVVQMPHCEGNKVRVTVRLVHKSGEYMDAGDFEALVQQATPQAIGSGLSYGRRYTYAPAVGVVVDDDDDGEAAEARPAPKQNGSAALKAKLDAAAEMLGADVGETLAQAKAVSDRPPGALTYPFGKWKGKVITAVPADQLAYWIQRMEGDLDNPEQEKWHEKTKLSLAIVKAELERRKESQQ